MHWYIQNTTRDIKIEHHEPLFGYNEENISHSIELFIFYPYPLFFTLQRELSFELTSNSTSKQLVFIVLWCPLTCIIYCTLVSTDMYHLLSIQYILGVRFMVFIATFNSISVTQWRSVLLVEETGEIHRPAASHWQFLSHNVVLSTLRLWRKIYKK